MRRQEDENFKEKIRFRQVPFKGNYSRVVDSTNNNSSSSTNYRIGPACSRASRILKADSHKKIQKFPKKDSEAMR